MAEISDRNHRAVPQTSGLVFHWAFTYGLLLRVLWRGSERIYREKVVQLAGMGRRVRAGCWLRNRDSRYRHRTPSRPYGKGHRD